MSMSIKHLVECHPEKSQPASCAQVWAQIISTDGSRRSIYGVAYGQDISLFAVDKGFSRIQTDIRAYFIIKAMSLWSVSRDMRRINLYFVVFMSCE